MSKNELVLIVIAKWVLNIKLYVKKLVSRDPCARQKLTVLLILISIISSRNPNLANGSIFFIFFPLYSNMTSIYPVRQIGQQKPTPCKHSHKITYLSAKNIRYPYYPFVHQKRKHIDLVVKQEERMNCPLLNKILKISISYMIQ